MNRYILTAQAEDDLEDIWIFLAARDHLVADRQIAQILNQFAMLAQFPNLGRQRDDLPGELRSFAVKPYVIFYRGRSGVVEIVRILHQSRDVGRQFE